MDHRMFDPQLPVLTQAGYRVLTWDMRGHGVSKPIGRTPITIRDFADDLLAILNELGVATPICVVGQSLGALLAQDIVYRHAERVACVVVIGATCMTLPIAWWESAALKSSPFWLRLWPYAQFQRLLARVTALRPEVQAYALEATRQLNKQEFFHIWEAVAGAIRPIPGYRIEHPLLLTHGDQDRTGNIAKTAPRWAARDPNSRYEVIPDASHNANQDNPVVFNRILLDFLGEHYPVSYDPPTAAIPLCDSAAG
jgi:pimeloyl-ACP methyl ester carboxylesterase